jgi:hypothetical protein
MKGASVRAFFALFVFMASSFIRFFAGQAGETAWA